SVHGSDLPALDSERLVAAAGCRHGELPMQGAEEAEVSAESSSTEHPFVPGHLCGSRARRRGWRTGLGQTESQAGQDDPDGQPPGEEAGCRRQAETAMPRWLE